jgi:protein-tyrosine phosphatase
MPEMTPSLLIPGTFNSRDLGGTSADGGTVRPRLVIRSDAPVAIAEAGRNTVRTIGIRTALDLREPIERELDPADFADLEIEQVNVQILGEGFELARDISMAEVYRLLLEQRGEKLTAAVRLLAEPGRLPALVFCSAGKDRTGLVAALTLGAVGVGDDEIVRDYAITEQNMQGPFRDAIIRRAHNAGITEQELAAKVGSPPALMRDVLQWLRDQHGGPQGFLRWHGMTTAELERLQTALLAPRAAKAA